MEKSVKQKKTAAQWRRVRLWKAVIFVAALICVAGILFDSMFMPAPRPKARSTLYLMEYFAVQLEAFRTEYGGYPADTSIHAMSQTLEQHEFLITSTRSKEGAYGPFDDWGIEVLYASEGVFESKDSSMQLSLSYNLRSCGADGTCGGADDWILRSGIWNQLPEHFSRLEARLSVDATILEGGVLLIKWKIEPGRTKEMELTQAKVAFEVSGGSCAMISNGGAETRAGWVAWPLRRLETYRGSLQVKPVFESGEALKATGRFWLLDRTFVDVSLVDNVWQWKGQ